MRFRTSWRVAAVLVAMLVSGRAGAADAPAGVAGDGIDARIQARMAESGLVGVGAAVIIDRKVAWSKGYGFADKQRGVPFTPDTVMAIGSISKTFTGVAMMQAVQDGRLSLDEDINRYLPFKVVHPAFPGRASRCASWPRTPRASRTAGRYTSACTTGAAMRRKRWVISCQAI
jgi:CubicO group peptidase (beta-lactamase class C family)